MNHNSTSVCETYEKININIRIEEKNYSSGGHSADIYVATPYSMSSYDSDNQVDHSEWETEFQEFPFIGPIADNSYLIMGCPQEVYTQGILGVVNYISKMPNCTKISENEISVTIFLRTIR